MKLPSLIFFLFFSISVGYPQPSQTTPPEEADSTIEADASVVKTGVNRKGQFVIGLQIRALNRRLAMGEIKELDPLSRDVPKNFSLRASYLVDTYTSNKIAANPSLPYRPYYGPMDLITIVPQGGWVQMGISFPIPPPPPLDKFGNPQAYKLQLFLPLKAKPIDITFSVLPEPSA